MHIFDVKNIQVQADDKIILNKLSFTVDKGEFITVTGPSGSGKSTLLKALATLRSYTSGEVLFNGKNIKDYDPIEYRKEVSYCFQQPVLFGQTVRDNLSFPFKIRKKTFDENEAIKALNNVDLDASFIDKPITELSGGEKQRVALIRNLMFPPQVLLLDEVSTGLDETTKASVHKLIKSVNEKGITILSVTHDNEEIKMASRIIEVTKGGTENGQ